MFQTLTHIIRSIQTTLAITLSGARLQPLRIETRRNRRGATFIEYALLAGAALVLVVILRNRLESIIRTLLQGLDDEIN